MTHDAQCMLRVVDGLLFKALEGGGPERVCESGQPERVSDVCFIPCAMLMRHAPWQILRHERVRSNPSASGDPGLVRAYRAFVRFVRFICVMPGRKVTLSCGRGLASKRAASSCHKIPLWCRDDADV